MSTEAYRRGTKDLNKHKRRRNIEPLNQVNWDGESNPHESIDEEAIKDEKKSKQTEALENPVKLKIRNSEPFDHESRKTERSIQVSNKDSFKTKTSKSSNTEPLDEERWNRELPKQIRNNQKSSHTEIRKGEWGQQVSDIDSFKNKGTNTEPFEQGRWNRDAIKQESQSSDAFKRERREKERDIGSSRNKSSNTEPYRLERWDWEPFDEESWNREPYRQKSNRNFLEDGTMEAFEGKNRESFVGEIWTRGPKYDSLDRDSHNDEFRRRGRSRAEEDSMSRDEKNKELLKQDSLRRDSFNDESRMRELSEHRSKGTQSSKDEEKKKEVLRHKGFKKDTNIDEVRKKELPKLEGKKRESLKEEIREPIFEDSKEPFKKDIKYKESPKQEKVNKNAVSGGSRNRQQEVNFKSKNKQSLESKSKGAFKQGNKDAFKPGLSMNVYTYRDESRNRNPFKQESRNIGKAKSGNQQGNSSREANRNKSRVSSKVPTRNQLRNAYKELESTRGSYREQGFCDPTCARPWIP